MTATKVSSMQVSLYHTKQVVFQETLCKKRQAAHDAQRLVIAAVEIEQRHDLDQDTLWIDRGVSMRLTL